MKTIAASFAALLLVAGCVTEQTAERPMDEVPGQNAAPNGDREYRFKSGCLIVLEPTRAVVKSEAGSCELHHRDIALLYASAD